MNCELEIRLLGDLQVVRSGKQVELPHSRKTRALMAYLIGMGRPLMREHLCDLFWDNPNDPRAALRWSLSKIRPLLNTSVTRLQTHQNKVAFIPNGAFVDILHLYPAINSGLKNCQTSQLMSLAEHFRGEFLEGLELPECYRFQAWCANERETIRDFQMNCYSELALRFSHDPRMALRYIRRGIALNPLNEDAHARAIHLLGQMGQYREAINQYDTCVHILAAELNTQPSRKLLAERASLGRKAGPWRGSGGRTVRTYPQPKTFLGRQKEVEIFHQLVRNSMDGDNGRFLFISGEAGTGKTRLLDYFAGHIHSCNANILYGRAYETEMIRSYGPWIDALQSVTPEVFPRQFQKEFNALLPGNGSSSGQIRHNHLHYAVLRLLQSLAAETGMLAIIMDDIQWLDEFSAALLHYTAHIVVDFPVLFVLAARKKELAHNHHASRLMETLNNEYKIYPMELSPLTERETG